MTLLLPWVVDQLGHVWNSFDWAKAANLAAIVLAVYTWLRFIKPMLKAVAYFLEDWNGENRRKGIRPRPGVMERIQFLEHELEMCVQSEIQLHNEALARDEEIAGLKRSIRNIEGMIKNVDVYVKENTGVIPAQKASASSQG